MPEILSVSADVVITLGILAFVFILGVKGGYWLKGREDKDAPTKEEEPGNG